MAKLSLYVTEYKNEFISGEISSTSIQRDNGYITAEFNPSYQGLIIEGTVGDMTSSLSIKRITVSDDACTNNLNGMMRGRL